MPTGQGRATNIQFLNPSRPGRTQHHPGQIIRSILQTEIRVAILHHRDQTGVTHLPAEATASPQEVTVRLAEKLLHLHDHLEVIHHHQDRLAVAAAEADRAEALQVVAEEEDNFRLPPFSTLKEAIK